MATAFCPNCGSRLPSEGAAVCENCGRTTGAVQPAVQAQSNAVGYGPASGQYSAPSREIKNPWLAAIPSAILALPFGDNWQGGYYLFYLVLGWIYYAYLESSPEQSTFGKRALGLVVTDVYGNRLDFTRASIRYVGRIVSTVILYLGFVLIAFSDKKQGLHDMIAGTLVVYKR